MARVKPQSRQTLRAARAAVTRDRIAEAGRRLFVRDGYGATTLRAVAVEAGVAIQTVYAVYGSKAGILEALRERVVQQPEAEALFDAALRESDAEQAISLLARSIRRRWEAGGDVVMIHQAAAAMDPAVRGAVDAVLARRRAGLARFAHALREKGADSENEESLLAVLDTLTLPEIYQQLVGPHRWTADRYERWLTQSLLDQLVNRRPARLAREAIDLEAVQER